jgi:hypothetical protein
MEAALVKGRRKRALNLDDDDDGVQWWKWYQVRTQFKTVLMLPLSHQVLMWCNIQVQGQQPKRSNLLSNLHLYHLDQKRSQ